MTDWLALALDAVPIVPLAPIAPHIEPSGTIGTIGTPLRGGGRGSLPIEADVARAEVEERAAILEYDEGLTRDEAERLAAKQMPHRAVIRAAKSATVAHLPPANSLSRMPAGAGTAAPKPTPKPPADPFALRPADWMPEPGPGITILRPAVEVEPAEYDAHLDAMITALPDGSPERSRLAFAKRKGWCVDRGSERIFVRGRT